MTHKTTPVEELNNLHTVVAKVLIDELTKSETIIVDDKEVEISAPSPAMVAQAIKFLKDNNISSTPEEDKNLQSLEVVLKNKAKHSRLATVSPIQAAGDSSADSNR